ncbi:Cell wall-binding protein YocH [Lentibacillus sp. JNUCC-1]|uniref:3D domain-containing protein n=1 Tax=Lentibacillus sp. JNUCC-1 TaxID=2654513 RepID=UPI0012E723CD|nr:Cell wall-binding protein YocH [Lentibacillus sp. JNUCC-1]
MKKFAAFFAAILFTFCATAIGVSAQEDEVKIGDNFNAFLNINDITDDELVHIQGLKHTSINSKQPLKFFETEQADHVEVNAPKGKTIPVTATAYTASCDGCSGTTYTGVDLIANPDAKVIAVDPDVIPLGSKVYVEGYGYATAEDIGSAIQGDRVDLFIPSEKQAFKWGRQSVDVTILD